MILTSRYELALAFTAWLHARQFRKCSEIPYLSHLLAVSGLVMEHGGDEDEAIAGLLHDAIEDQAQLFGDAENLRTLIRDRFGERVLEIVNGCTDSQTLPKRPWRERKEAFLSRLPRAGHSVVLVTCCDKLHNARTLLIDLREIGDSLWNRFNGGKKGTLWYYRSIVEISRKNLAPVRLVDELERSVHAISCLS